MYNMYVMYVMYVYNMYVMHNIICMCDEALDDIMVERSLKKTL